MTKFKRKERKQAIKLCKKGNMSFKEISEKLNVRPNTVGEWINSYQAQQNLSADITELKKLINKELDSTSPNNKKINQLLKSINSKILKMETKHFKIIKNYG